MTKAKEAWGTRVGLILAMAGNAVGLGNFLRFPVQAVQNGGGAFIIPYIICFLVMGLPLLWIEWSIGRFGGRHGHHSTPFIFDGMFKKPIWKYVGVFGIFNNIAVAAYYCYIESWTLSYVYHSIIGSFENLDQNQVADFFDKFLSFNHSTTGLPSESLVFYLICLALNMYILSKGLKGGVERVAKIGVPLLLIFGAFLAVRGITLGSGGAPDGCSDCNSFLGLNYLWEPQFSSLMDPKVWLAAAGQIFFTLSIGMGTVHCYASYVKENDDIALNAMSAGWLNGFVEIVLGASIVIPIAVGYLGLDWVVENAGFNMAFQTMPYLFEQWGPVFSTLSGVFWFGLLFIAGITSSVAFGTPWLGFMEDEFDWGRKRAAWSLGGLILLIGLPTVYFYDEGVFGEYDYWAGTVALVIFALAESLLFSIYGINRGWNELNNGSDIRIPGIFKPIMRYITPVLLLFVFITSLVTPINNDWSSAWSRLKEKREWNLDANSIIGKISNLGIKANRSYFSEYLESDIDGSVMAIKISEKGKKSLVLGTLKSYYRNEANQVILITQNRTKPLKYNSFDSLTTTNTYAIPAKARILLVTGDSVNIGQRIAEGSFINRIFFIDMAKLLLTLLFLFLTIMVYWVGVKNKLKKIRP